MWLDRILVLVGMAGLVAFCAVVMYYVAEPDLIVVMTICLVIGFYDFWVNFLRPGASRTGARGGGAATTDDRTPGPDPAN